MSAVKSNFSVPQNNLKTIITAIIVIASIVLAWMLFSPSGYFNRVETVTASRDYSMTAELEKHDKIGENVLAQMKDIPGVSTFVPTVKESSLFYKCHKSQRYKDLSLDKTLQICYWQHQYVIGLDPQYNSSQCAPRILDVPEHRSLFIESYVYNWGAKAKACGPPLSGKDSNTVSVLYNVFEPLQKGDAVTVVESYSEFSVKTIGSFDILAMPKK